MSLDTLGRLLLITGCGLALLGGVLLVLSRVPALQRPGGLPGDLKIVFGGGSCLIPLGTMLAASLLLTIILNVVIWFIRR